MMEADMDVTDKVNPLSLSLDDLIKLNKYRNQAQESDKASDLTVRNKTSLSNGCSSDEDENSLSLKTNGTLFRQDLQAQRKSVHERLGWKSAKSSYNHDKALKAIRNAQNFKARVDIRNRYSDANNGDSRLMPPPLTVSSLRRHNRFTGGNFPIPRRGNRARSVASMSFSSVRVPHRHSMKKSLNPQITAVIKDFMNDGNPNLCQSEGESFIVEHTFLPHYRVTPDCLDIPTYLTFIMNDQGA